LPAIDGIRAIAVVAVMLYHCDIGWLEASGFLGVDVFFVVSGFLITAQLIHRVERQGSAWSMARVMADYREFLVRRVRRLMPTLVALFCVLLVVCPLVAPSTLVRLLEDIPAGLLAMSNVWQMISKQSYFETAERQALLQHLWSLAIEWHFYLVWPLVLAVALRLRGRAGLAVLSLVGACASMAWMAWLSVAHGYPDEADPSRVYLGTDTHAMGLFAGAFLASIWRAEAVGMSAPRRQPPSRALATDSSASIAGRLVQSGRRWMAAHWHGVTAFFALVAIVLSFDIGHESQGWLYRGGFLLVSIATALLIFATSVRESPVANLLSSRVLRWCGLRSYSLYVWHWPVFLLLRPGHELPDMPILALIIRMVVTSALAEVSWRWVEMPLRQVPPEGWVRSVQVRGVLACLALAVVLVPVNWPAFVAPPPEAPTVEFGPGGGVLTAIGDSVMLGMKNHLEHTYQGVHVDAAVGRQGSQGLARVNALRASGELAPAVAVHLGTNGYLGERHLRELLEALADRRKVVLFNVHARRRWIAENNALIARVVPDYPNVTLVNWDRIGQAHPEYFVPDGIHLTVRGIMAFADLMRGAVVLPLAAVDAGPRPVSSPKAAARGASRQVGVSRAPGRSQPDGAVLLGRDPEREPERSSSESASERMAVPGGTSQVGAPDASLVAPSGAAASRDEP
jgi:peptidoglycan/LPS O-acetylase OafA/YrhL